MPRAQVGIARKNFSHASRMPGWDSHSYGYHGDDGHRHVQALSCGSTIDQELRTCAPTTDSTVPG